MGMPGDYSVLSELERSSWPRSMRGMGQCRKGEVQRVESQRVESRKAAGEFETPEKLVKNINVGGGGSVLRNIAVSL